MNVRNWTAAAVLAVTMTQAHAAQPIPVKVMIVSMFGPEGQVWLDRRRMDHVITVPGLPKDSPTVHCDVEGACQVTIGMGYANAAASIGALTYTDRLDLRHAYWLVAGIAGINPHRGTLGSVTWAHFLVDGGLEWELDARQKPRNWPTGYLGIGAGKPDEKPKIKYGTEMFELNNALVRRAFALSSAAKLADSPDAQHTRAAYPAPADQPPSVVQCDTVSDDTWVSGVDLAERMDTWTRVLTDGRGAQCTTQQEDNATVAVLTRASATGRVDAGRIMVMRTASDFDRPPPGGDDVRNLLGFQAQGGFGPAIANLYFAGNLVVQNIVKNWSIWENGVPPG